MFLDITKINSELAFLTKGNEEYAKFNKRIVNTQKSVLGVRVPDLRKLAKKLARDIDGDEIEKLLLTIDRAVYEQVLLCGLIISYAKLTDEQKISLTKKYLPLVDSWAEVDAFVQKRNLKNKRIWWNFAVNCLKSDREFVVRYGVIELMLNFLDQSDIDRVLATIRTIKHQGYYVKMAMAWLYATAAVNFHKQTLEEIKNSDIDLWIKKKALQKCWNRVSLVWSKKEIRKLRNKIVPRVGIEPT